MEKRDNVRPNLAVLHPHALAQVCRRSHLRPAADLAAYIAVHWVMEWDVPEGESYPQQVLPNPCVQIIVNAKSVDVLGIVTSAFTATLAGREFVLGVKFRPAGFYPFVQRPVAEFTDQRLPLSGIWPDAPVAGICRRAADGDSQGVVELMEATLRRRLTPTLPEISQAVDLIAATPTLLTVEDLAGHSGLTVRTLQRLFHRYVGVGPKWVIRRYRLQEAAARIEAGETEDWADLAQRLGYFDQSHFVREFSELAGQPPAAYGKGRPADPPPKQLLTRLERHGAFRRG